jgi:hypothetical protein
MIYTSEEITMTRTTSWRYNDNGTIKVHTVTTTYREAGHTTETISEFRARHDGACDADQITYPPVSN